MRNDNYKIIAVDELFHLIDMAVRDNFVRTSIKMETAEPDDIYKEKKSKGEKKRQRSEWNSRMGKYPQSHRSKN